MITPDFGKNKNNTVEVLTSKLFVKQANAKYIRLPRYNDSPKQ